MRGSKGVAMKINSLFVLVVYFLVSWNEVHITKYRPGFYFFGQEKEPPAVSVHEGMHDEKRFATSKEAWIWVGKNFSPRIIDLCKVKVMRVEEMEVKPK